MQIIPFLPDPGKSITQFGSQQAVGRHLADLTGSATIVAIRIEPGGLLGFHPATDEQLLCVIEGEGDVCGSDRVFQPLAAGQAALWRRGENHEIRSFGGLTALVIEGQQVAPV
jgi:mannose-6-phosphate isomerase-like protein (cupin superfamily)